MQIRSLKQLFLLLLATVALLSIPQSVIADDPPTSQWERLTADQQNKVLEAFAKELPGRLSPSNEKEALIKEYSSLLIDNARKWSVYAAEISEGNYTHVLNIMVPVAQVPVTMALDTFIEEYDNDNDTHIGSYYKVFKKSSDSVIKVGQAIIDPNKNWSEVLELAWNETLTQIEAQLKDYAKDVVKQTVDYALGDLTTLNYSPGDIYLLVIETWTQVIDVNTRKFRRNVQNELYSEYLARLVENKDRFGNVSIDRAAAHEWVEELMVTGRYFSGTIDLGLSAQEMNALFDKFHTEGMGTDFYQWMDGRVKAINNKLEGEEKTKFQNAMNQMRQKAQEGLNKKHAEISKLLNELIEEQLTDDDKKKRDEAIAKARALQKIVESASGHVVKACADYDTDESVLLDLIQKRDSALNSVKGLSALINSGFTDIANYKSELDALEDEVKKFEGFDARVQEKYDLVEEATDKSCKAGDAVKEAKNKKDAKKALDDCIDYARDAKKAHEEAQKISGEGRKTLGDLVVKISKYKSTYGGATLEKVKENIAKIEQILAEADAAEKSRGDFDATINRMISGTDQGIRRAEMAVRHAEQISSFAATIGRYHRLHRTPSSAGPSAPSGVTDALINFWDSMGSSAGITIGLLDPWRGHKDVEAIIAAVGALMKNLECIAPKYQLALSWKKEKFPDHFVHPNLKTQAEAALTKANEFVSTLGKQGVLDDATQSIGDWLDKLKELDSMKFSYEICVADAILQYNDKWLKSPFSITNLKVVGAGGGLPKAGQAIKVSAEVSVRKYDGYLAVEWKRASDGASQIDTINVSPDVVLPVSHVFSSPPANFKNIKRDKITLKVSDGADIEISDGVSFEWQHGDEHISSSISPTGSKPLSAAIKSGEAVSIKSSWQIADKQGTARTIKYYIDGKELHRADVVVSDGVAWQHEFSSSIGGVAPKAKSIKLAVELYNPQSDLSANGSALIRLKDEEDEITYANTGSGVEFMEGDPINLNTGVLAAQGLDGMRRVEVSYRGKEIATNSKQMKGGETSDFSIPLPTQIFSLGAKKQASFNVMVKLFNDAGRQDWKHARFKIKKRTGTAPTQPGGLQDVYCQSPNVVIKIWDHQAQDGDIIRLALGNEIILDGFNMNGCGGPSEPQGGPCVRAGTLTNLGGSVAVSIYAYNEGDSPPNTAALKVDGGCTPAFQQWELKAGQSSSIKVLYAGPRQIQ